MITISRDTLCKVHKGYYYVLQELVHCWECCFFCELYHIFVARKSSDRMVARFVVIVRHWECSGISWLAKIEIIPLGLLAQVGGPVEYANQTAIQGEG